jgi:hypothetical protein
MPIQIDPNAGFTIEKMNTSHGHCDCCGGVSHSVAGLLYNGGVAIAAYWMNWTEGHLSDSSANLDLVLGQWGEETGPADRYAVAMVHRQLADGTPSLMVIDAEGRPAADGRLAHVGLRRDQVIGTPLAVQVFAMTDAIYEQDERFF